MDVLELPRPVINFLRTMAKESCRYALSWDIFGGPDSVTLTLTWKLIDEDNQSSILNETTSPLSSSSSTVVKQANYDDSLVRSRSTIKTSSPTSPSSRRSRRDETLLPNENASIPAIFRSSRGKSLEGSSLHTNKSNPCQHQHTKDYQHVSSLERTNIPNHHQHRSKKGAQQKQFSTKSDQVYGNLYDTRSASVVKCATISSLSSSSPSPQPNTTTTTSSTNPFNPLLSAAHTHHQRAKQPQSQQPSITSPSVRKPIRPSGNISRTAATPTTSHISSTYTSLRRTNNNLATHEADLDDDDDTLDPWVKRFECSLEDNDDDDDDTTENSDEKERLPLNPTPVNMDDSGNTSGKVKFKTKPDYF